jgi:tubulin-specific chaperone D
VIELNCRISKENNDPEKRKYAVQSLEALVKEVGFASEKLNEEVIAKIFDILSTTVEDYTMDKRGDIGSIVREESMSAMIHIIDTYCNSQEKKWKISD